MMLESAGLVLVSSYILVATSIMFVRSLIDEGRNYDHPYTYSKRHYVQMSLWWLPNLLRPIAVLADELYQARKTRARYNQWRQVAWQ